MHGLDLVLKLLFAFFLLLTAWSARTIGTWPERASSSTLTRTRLEIATANVCHGDTPASSLGTQYNGSLREAACEHETEDIRAATGDTECILTKDGLSL